MLKQRRHQNRTMQRVRIKVLSECINGATSVVGGFLGFALFLRFLVVVLVFVMLDCSVVVNLMVLNTKNSARNEN